MEYYLQAKDVMKNVGPKFRQIKQYDKIFKENMEAALPGILKHLLSIHAVHTEELPDSIQHTKEREPDVLKKVTDKQGSTYVLQIEFQLSNEPEMVYRMAEYYIMLYRKYKLPIRQHVAYIGDTRPSMPDHLHLQHLQFQYSLLSLTSVDYHLFLRSDRPEEKILALLGDFGHEDPNQAMKNIVVEVIASSSGELEVKKHMEQLRILAQLRNLAPQKSAIMQSIATFFKEENDILYQMGLEKGEAKGEARGEAIGEARGIEKKTHAVVRNLLLQTRFTLPRIAALVGVTEEFVQQVKREIA